MTPEQKESILIMSNVHALQFEAWLTTLIQSTRPVQRFKQLSNQALASIRNFNAYLKNFDEQEFELSSQVSDSILNMVTLSKENREKVYKLIAKLNASQQV